MRAIHPVNTFRYEAKRDTNPGGAISWSTGPGSFTVTVFNSFFTGTSYQQSLILLNDIINTTSPVPYLRQKISFNFYGSAPLSSPFSVSLSFAAHLYNKSLSPDAVSLNNPIFLRVSQAASGLARATLRHRTDVFFTQGLTVQNGNIQRADLKLKLIGFNAYNFGSLMSMQIKNIGGLRIPQKNRIEDNYRFFNR